MRITDISNSSYYVCGEDDCEEVFKVQIPMYKDLMDLTHVSCPYCGCESIEYASGTQMRRFHDRR